MSTKKKVVEIKEDSNLFELVGSIVEKGFSSESSSQSNSKRNPISFPQPTVLPFPVARHRSHGPHWAPLGSEMDVDDVNEDEDDKDFNTIPSTFAVPIQKKEKKGLSFNNWKEVLQRDSLSKGTEIAKSTLRHSVKGKREREESGNIAKNSTCELFLSRSMEFGRVPTTSSETVMSSEIRVRNVDQAMVDSFSKNVEREQMSTPLEVQIDEENRSRLQQMSHDEIAEARAEILEKMNPGLLEKLKKRGENKVGKPKNLQSNRDNGCETGSRLDAIPIIEDLKSKEGSPSAEAKCSPAVTPKDVQIGGVKISNKPSSEIWNAWSERVEAARMLRFSLDGHVSESWSWSFVSPMVKFALKWISFESDPCLSEIFDCNKITSNNSQDPSLSSCLWVISSVMYLLRGILVKVAPEGSNSLHESGGRVPWLPEFVPEIGLAILKNRYLNIGDTVLSEGDSLIKDLCDLRLHSIELSLSSVCCLHRLVQLIVSLDNLIQLAKREIPNLSFSENNFSGEGDILESGIVIWTQDQLRSVLETIMALVSSGWEKVHAIETFGRGGPAPGVGLGWGASGGGFWSGLVLLEQTDARLLMNLLDIFQIDYGRHISTVDDVNFTFVAQRIISVLETSLTLGPRDTYIMENVLDFLLQPSVLKYLNLFVRQFLHLKRSVNPCICAHNEEDYLRFSKILNSHFRNRWLCEKKKTKVVEGGVDLSQDTSEKGGNALDTIYEDSEEKSDSVAGNPRCTSLVVEWAHQRLPLPLHWFLSPISTVAGIGGAVELPNGSDVPNSMCPPSPGEAFDLAQSGLFLLLGLESLSTLLCSGLQASPVSRVPLVWKIHSLSVVLLVGMSLLYDENSRNTYETLQDLYGLLLDESRCQRSIKPLVGNSLLEIRIKDAVLKFQTDVHESYSTFIETLVEQFGAISYGDLVYARQVAVYLHHSVEAPVRVAAWNALSGAHLLELLPPLEKCIAKSEGYLESEDNEGILEAYLKSWVSGTLDKASVRGSMAFTIALHHLSSFVFQYTADDKLTLRNKIARSLLRDSSRKKQHEAMMLDLIRYAKTGTSQEHKLELETSEIEKRFKILTGACEGNSALLSQVEKLKSFFLH
ncbi:hypothetical protein C5167_050641 [Papaver somniferum]|uniref:Uncharacterized protein n=1 Tax=Papaver somniferum TaxID=3469 RepID=A0A4Y7KS36_PAPSO|nr:transcriptional elongation regulator MINIYO-like [Papaver somniferum]RZC75170.1 hypothetical protein C5167_050641 [Papaver somniferum]